MPIATRRGRRVSPLSIWAAVGAALSVHGTVLASVDALDVIVMGEGLSTRKPDIAAMVAPELKSNCAGDAYLAASARTALCFAPWRSDTDQCINDSELAMYMDLSACLTPEEADR